MANSDYAALVDATGLEVRAAQDVPGAADFTVFMAGSSPRIANASAENVGGPGAAESATPHGEFLGTRILSTWTDGPVEVDKAPFIDHFVWSVFEANLDAYAERLRTLVGADFEECVFHGGRVLISWECGLELVAPKLEVDAVGQDSRSRSAGIAGIREHLLSKGESACNVVIRVPDLIKAADRAKLVGYPVGDQIQAHDPELRKAFYHGWTNKILDNREVSIGSFLGLGVLFSQIEYSN